MVLQNMHPFVEVMLICQGLTWVGTLIFVLLGVYLWGSCILGVGQGYLSWGLVACLSGVCMLFPMEISYTTINKCIVCSTGGNGSKGLTKSG